MWLLQCPHSVALCPTWAPGPVTAHHCHSASSLSLSSDTWLSLFWLVPKLLYSPSFLEGRDSIAKLEGNRYRTASEVQRWKTEKNRQKKDNLHNGWLGILVWDLNFWLSRIRRIYYSFFPLETQLSFVGIFNLKSTKWKAGSHHVCNIQKV